MELDLGSSRLYRVPIYRDEQKIPSDLAPHYVLLVSEQKPDTFVPEASTDVRQGYKYGTTEIDPNSRWGPTTSRDQLAVRSSSSNGVDLWADPQLMARLFLTDRLKRAIKAAGVKSRALNFQKAILV